MAARLLQPVAARVKLCSDLAKDLRGWIAASQHQILGSESSVVGVGALMSRS